MCAGEYLGSVAPLWLVEKVRAEKSSSGKMPQIAELCSAGHRELTMHEGIQ